MEAKFTRRGVLQIGAATAALPLVAGRADAGVFQHRDNGWISGRLTGAEATVAALQQQNVACVFGIPGAQENELWDVFKSRRLPYLLVTHEMSAACMADGYARASGCVGVLATVPGPGVTNALTGLGEALLDSVPLVVIAGDVSCKPGAKPFQVHSLDQVALLKPVTKGVFRPICVGEIPGSIQQAFALARAGEPGPTAVVIPYNLFFEVAHFQVPPPPGPELIWDESAAEQAFFLLADCRKRIGIYAGFGCMDHAAALCQVAELLEAPVATSVSGKGVFPESHPLAVGWGYGPQGTKVAEDVFHHVDCILAIGVRFSEVATGFYANPRPTTLIQVDANPNNLGRVLRTDVSVAADAGLFLNAALARGDGLRRPPDPVLRGNIQRMKCEDAQVHAKCHARCGVDPMALVLALRRALPEDALTYVDVSLAEHLAAEAFCVRRPRTYFNPTDNQAMGWSVSAAIGGQRAFPGRPTVAIVGDGCFLMSAQEISTAAREALPVKFFVLDNHAYHYMQVLQQQAYVRTTATHLARIDYAALAAAYGVTYREIVADGQLDGAIRTALCLPGPVLIRVATDYGDRKIRWIEAVRSRFIDELSFDQKVRFLARVGKRTLDPRADNSD